MQIEGRKRWLAFWLLCTGTLMIVLDTTIVNVALPSIQTDLHFSETSLVWVVNAYMLTFGGFLLLGGRLGDIYGQRRIFLAGLTLFTLASLACGVADTQGLLVAARAAQGVGGAVVDAVALSLIMMLFTAPAERARAMGIYGFVCAGGGSLGVLLGGLLTDALGWHWVFLVNIPIGVALYGLCLALLPRDRGRDRQVPLDVGGAITITLSLMLAVYAIVNGNAAGWASTQTLMLLGAASLLLAAFLAIQARVRAPLMPLSFFRVRSLNVAGITGGLWAAAMFAWFFICALYLQRVLGYSPLEIGLAFLPTNLIMAACSLGLSARLVMRFGIRAPLAAGLALEAIALALFARAPLGGDFMLDVLPGMVFMGLGAGIALNPILLAAMSEVKPEDSGLASGIVNTAFMMGGALGLAALVALADMRSDALLASGTAQIAALNGGYQLAFLGGALFAAVAAVMSAVLLAPGKSENAPGSAINDAASTETI